MARALDGLRILQIDLEARRNVGFDPFDSIVEIVIRKVDGGITSLVETNRNPAFLITEVEFVDHRGEERRFDERNAGKDVAKSGQS